jgi:hypothetical protein
MRRITTGPNIHQIIQYDDVGAAVVVIVDAEDALETTVEGLDVDPVFSSSVESILCYVLYSNE